MFYFNELQEKLDKAHTVLSEQLAEKLKTAIYQVAKKHLKNRSLKFDHSMGSITLEIGLRGNNGSIDVSENHKYNHVSGKASYMAYHFLKTPCILELTQILSDYDALGPALQVERGFTITV